ncbi:MAG: hypothetical protein ABSA47_09260 [Verrucomicrobiota bacterium]|jgi:hypothetical protein
MDQIRTFGDERQLAYCAFCGGETGTRDHCPPRVLLDEPYPENLPVVPACSACNSRVSADEEYLACLVSCVLAGSTDPSRIQRKKIRRILTDKPALRSRLEQARVTSEGLVSFRSEPHRVIAVIKKLAQGHALYELHEPCLGEPETIELKPLDLMADDERDQFEHPARPWILPEVGSRAMQRVIIDEAGPNTPWIEVQEGTYRFHSSPVDRVSIRIVISEYLACHVHWTQ